MSDYPEAVSLEGKNLQYLREHSQLIDTLYELEGFQGRLKLSADLLFEGDQKKWALFYDLFFPEEGAGKLFNIRGNTLIVKENRGGEEALLDILNYMMVDSPKTMMKFAREQASKQINAPSAYVSTAPRAKGKMSFINYRNMNGNYNNDYYNNLYNKYNNTNNNSNNTKIGYTEEEEEYLGKLPGTLAKQYYRNQRRTSNRRTRKQNRKSRKTRRQNRK